MNMKAFSFTWGDRISPILGVLCGVILAVASIACTPPEGEESSSEAACSPVPGEVITRIGDPLPADATMREVLEHPDTFERIQRVAQILQRSGPEDLETLMIEFETAAHERGAYEYGLFGHWWARFDPQAAFIYANNQLRFEAPMVVIEVVRAWAQTDPIGALETNMLNMAESRIPTMRDEYTDAFVVGWFEQMDAHGGEGPLMNWIVTQQDGGGVQRGLKAFARMRVLRDGDQETLDWIRSEPYEPVVNRLLLAGALSVIAHQNPKLASEWLPIAAADGVDVRTFRARIARSWAHHQPRAALDWVMTQPEDGERNTSISVIARQWLRKDEPGLAAWLATVEDAPWTDPLRNQATRYHVNSSDYRLDWPNVMARAQAIHDPKQRHGLLAWVLRRWFVVDLEAANQWVEDNPEALGEDFVARARKISPRERAEIEAALEGVSLAD